MSTYRFLLTALCAAILLSLANSSQARDYKFDGSMSEPVLRNYLSRSMTTMGLLTGPGDLGDNIRMLTNCGVKFAGRAVYQWGRENGGEGGMPGKFEIAKANAEIVHQADPEIILQGCVFEIVTRDVEKLAIPARVFEAFGMPVEKRNFNYEAMTYPSGRGKNQWGQNASVPDISQMESKLWFYYAASSYIDAGCEAMHFGQVEIMNGNDKHSDNWFQVLDLVRAYAKKHARRHFVLCDAHVPGGGLVRDGKLLLDAHAFPLRIEEMPDHPKEGRLRAGFIDSIYGRSKGGVTPSGWKCDHLPCLVELDNYGHSRKPGEPGMGGCWVWGWDEITWFCQLSETARNDWLRYAWKWVRENDPACYLEMPGSRCLSGSPDGKRWYFANKPGPLTPEGFNQEAAIKEIWANDSAD